MTKYGLGLVCREGKRLGNADLGGFPRMDSEFRARIRGLEWFVRRARKSL